MAVENEPEVIRQQMDETRSALTDKIATLEAQVVETVEGASAGVRETVESVKGAVQDTVETVRETVAETVESVRETFSIEKQIERRPWTVMALSAGIGFAAGYLATPAPRRSRFAHGPEGHFGHGRHEGSWLSDMGAAASSAVGSAVGAVGAATGIGQPSTSTNGRRHEGEDERASAAPEAAMSSLSSSGGETARTGPSSGPGLFDSLAHMFGGEISALKGMAIGALGGMLRDFVVPQVPEALREKAHEVIDNVTSKLGGEPVKGPLFGDETHEEKEAGSERSEPFSSRMGSHN